LTDEQLPRAMSVYERSTRVRAPLSEVWAFHSRVDGLTALTPGWMNMRVESVRGPDGKADPGILEARSTVELSVQPFGVGPRQGWTSRIVERREGDGSAVFRDEMADGPFRQWVHTHSFFADGGSTVVRDRIEYRFPGGQIGRFAERLWVIGFEPMFRFRHRRTKELLE
jgi:ligand-binding SRPBCC domain-containing protein